MENAEVCALLLKERDELHDWAKLIVQTYMTWFSFFVTSNLVVMGWLHSTGKLLLPIFVVFALLDLSGIVPTLLVKSHLERSTERILKLTEAMIPEDWPSFAARPLPAIPLRIISATTIFNILCLLGIMSAWCYDIYDLLSRT